MPIDLILPVSISFSLLIWCLIFRWYVDPAARQLTLRQVLEPILWLHSFRYIGLLFLIPGVTSEALDPRFAEPAAYGDLIAAVLALVSLAALRASAAWALISVWIFNLWGLLDLLNAVGRGLLYAPAGEMGSTAFIPATVVPLLLVTHVYVFILLWRHTQASKQVSGLQQV